MPENSTLDPEELNLIELRLAEIKGGIDSISKRIPDKIPGIYLWYNSFYNLSVGNDFYSEFITAIKSPKHAPRTGRLNPDGEIELTSKPLLNKEEPIRLLANKKSFQNNFKKLISEHSQLFQPPLYIGKSKNLKQRIRSHLGIDSPLRNRFNEVNIDIDKCVLVMIETPQNYAKESEIELYEEIFSRLFNPTFTLRYG